MGNQKSCGIELTLPGGDVALESTLAEGHLFLARVSTLAESHPFLACVSTLAEYRPSLARESTLAESHPFWLVCAH